MKRLRNGSMKKLSLAVSFILLLGLLLSFIIPSAGVRVVSAQSAQMILFWDNHPIPEGWTCISNVKDDFFERYPRGAPTYGGEGGSLTHTHTATVLSCGLPSDNTTCQSGSTDVASSIHIHTSATVVPAANLPRGKGLRVISCDSGIPSTIPAGAIALFNSEPPAGWTRYCEQDGYFVRGAFIAGIPFGSNDHDHVVKTGDPTSTVSAQYYRYGTRVASDTHGHLEETDTQSSQPPYIEVILAQADSETSIPPDMIGMFNDSPGNGWTVISDVGGDMYHRFLKGSDSYGATGGAESHTHGDLTIATSPLLGTKVSTSSADIEAASQDHTHDNLVVSFSEDSHLPRYIDVIFAKPIQYVNTATDNGIAGFSTVNGSITGLTATISSPCGPTPDFVFPFGLFSFTVTGIAPGSTVTVTIVLPSNMPPGAEYWKCMTGHWINATSILGDNDGDNILTLTITDGSEFDADGQVNGIIVDPGGPVQAVAPVQTQPQASPPLARPLDAAKMSVQYMSVTPQQPSAGQPVTITTNVVNGGDQAGNYNIALRINGQVEQTKMVSVGPKATQPVKFTVSRSQPGTYSVDILDQTGSFTVPGNSGDTGTPVNGGMIILIALVGLVLAAAVLLVMKFRSA
jgi:hypothetical protein